MSGGEDNEEVADLRHAYGLLGGISERGPDGLPTRRYMLDGSPEEIAARKALARLLRSQGPLDGLVRQLLAGLFDPTPFKYFTKGPLSDKEAQESRADRQIRFKKIGRRNREDDRRFKLASDIWENAKEYGSVESAVVATAAKYNISESAVWKAWKQFKAKSWARL